MEKVGSGLPNNKSLKGWTPIMIPLDIFLLILYITDTAVIKERR
jgi:hypothetical protein